LRTTLHVTRADTRVYAGPSTDGALNAIGTDDYPRAKLADLSVRLQRDTPSRSVSAHCGRLEPCSQLSAGVDRVSRDRGFEARPIQDVTHITFGNANLRSVRCAEDDARDATRDPGRGNATWPRVEKFGQPSGPDAFTTANGSADVGITLDYHHRSAAAAACRVACGNQSRWAAAYDEKIAIFGGHVRLCALVGRAVNHRECEHRTGGDALLTPRAHWRVYMQSGLA
jgi:hypothetical protein